MSDRETAIQVKDLHKAFKLPHEKQDSIKGLFLNAFRGRKTYEKQKVLEDISFDIKKGEFFGIVGRNGSGKSTLLKLLAGIYTPDSGHVQVNGKLTPFIELGVGFNDELTGRENVYLNGALLGFNRQEMDDLYDEIVEFAELERFMDQKLKNYSSGMQVRLAFSIAIQAQSEILLLDEVLAVGDKMFQQKCYNYFKTLKSENKTVVLVSHDASVLEMFCNKGVLIDDGKIKHRGKISDVLHQYTNITTNKLTTDSTNKTETTKQEESDNPIVRVLSVHTENNEGKPQDNFKPKEESRVVFEVEPLQDINDGAAFGMIIQDAANHVLFATNNRDLKIKPPQLKKDSKYRIEYKLTNVFNNEELYISGAISSHDRSEAYHRVLKWHKFRSIGWDRTAKAPVYISCEASALPLSDT